MGIPTGTRAPSTGSDSIGNRVLLRSGLESSANADSHEFQFHFDQRPLDQLCRDRQLKTKEIHPTNDFYGQASVLKRYAGLPERYSLKSVLEHAPVLHDRMWQQDRITALPVNFGCSLERAKVMELHSGRPTYPIGFGFLYAKELLDKTTTQDSHPIQRRGTVVFPFKSTHMIDTHFDHRDYARRLARLPANMKPIVICIYWKDYLRGKHDPYAEQGFQIVSAGHMYDRDFLLRLYDICRHFRYAVSNEFGTHLFLSVASGCYFSYVASSTITRDVPVSEQSDYVQNNSGFQRVRRQSKKLFAEIREESSRHQRQFVDQILGTEFIRSPHELRHLIMRAELYDKLLPRQRISNATSHRWPTFWPRRIARLRASLAKKRIPF